jgi:hypothetical protein
MSAVSSLKLRDVTPGVTSQSSIMDLLPCKRQSTDYYPHSAAPPGDRFKTLVMQPTVCREDTYEVPKLRIVFQFPWICTHHGCW